MLEIKDLHAEINGKEILRGIDLTIRDGEVHALMGQNGAGKSTLSNVLVGHPAYRVTRGTVLFNGRDLLAMSPEDRAHEGLFLSFQTPVEIPGVSMVNFMRTAVNEQRKYRHQPALSASEFLKLMREKRAIVELDSKLANRSVNEGFSGGEKKRNEIFQMAMLEPRPRRRRPAHRGRRLQQAAHARDFCLGHHALPAPAGLPPAGHGARPAGRTHRQDRRAGTGAGDRAARIRLDQEGGERITD